MPIIQNYFDFLSWFFKEIVTIEIIKRRKIGWLVNVVQFMEWELVEEIKLFEETRSSATLSTENST
jgi:hypothetical protein